MQLCFGSNFVVVFFFAFTGGAKRGFSSSAHFVQSVGNVERKERVQNVGCKGNSQDVDEMHRQQQNLI